MISVGIDPGLTGAVAFLDRGACVIEDLPTMQLPGNGLVKRKIDGRALAALLRKHCPIGETVGIFVEQVRAMGGQNNAVQTQGSLMRTLGCIEGVLEVLRMPPAMVESQAWKRFYGLGADKAACLQVARTLYPGAPLKLAKHHNRAEALLIAHYGLQRAMS
jgi:hypothetical protein